jgi:hypothetical protein
MLLITWLLALSLAFTQLAPLFVATTRDGILFDNDDAMRLVQLREWMAGQGWTDLTQHRVDPPDSPVSHWSRIVELPLAGIILLTRLFAEPGAAERLAVAVWPSLLLAAFLLGLLLLGRRLIGPPALAAGALLVALNPVLLFQFLPGRIDHHGVQMVLVLALAALAARALFGGSSRSAVAAGVVSALTLAVGLETVPLVGAIAAAFGLAWIVKGESSEKTVAFFGASLAVAVVCAFASTEPPERWFVPTVDALSLPWLWLSAGGGVLLASLTRLRAPSMWRRAAYAAMGAALVCGTFAIVWPACLAGPYADLDPLTRELWLSGVGEARSLPILVLQNPSQFLFFLAFPLVGWVGLGIAAIRDGRREPSFLLLFGLATVALSVALDQMRGASFASIFGLFGWLYLIDRLIAAGRSRMGSAGGTAALVVAALVSAAALPFGWDAVAATVSPPEDVARPSCADPADMSALAAEPEGLVLAPLRLGPRILVATPHSVLGAPYHRNVDGNHVALAALSGDAEAARRIVEEREIAYVALCLGDPDLDRLQSRAGDSLTGRLVAGRPPPWLAPLPQVGPIRAWRVVEAR